MKFHKKTLVAVLVLAVAAALALTALAEYGSGAVNEGQTYTTEEMLTYAIEDEYMALAGYRAIVAAYGEYTPFTNLIEAEEYHISLLADLFETYGYAVPIDDAANQVALPDSLSAAFDVGAAAERNNIAMYETFLAQGAPEDVAAVFSVLKDASNNHLAAFEQVGGRAGVGGQNGGRGNACGNARGYRGGSCMYDNGDARNGCGRNGSRSRGTGWNRENCPFYAEDANP